MCRAALWFGVVGLCAAADVNPELLLARLRERVSADLRRMANFTCVETVTRSYYRPAVERATESCGNADGGKLQLWAVDRLKLDVAVTRERELYSWAGANQFEDRDLTEIVGGGPIGTGAFGAFLASVFGGRDAQFSYAGETTVGGRAAAEFRYRVPRAASHYRIRAADGWIVTAYEGNLLADAETADLVRLSIRTDRLAPETGSCETTTELDYRRAMGESGLLLPRETRQRFALRTGIEIENASTFEACREYRGQSTVTFSEEADTIPSGAVRPPQGAAFQIPIDLPVALEFSAPVDTWTASAGEMVPMRLAKPILDGARRLLVPAGAAVEARLIRVQRYFTRPGRATVVVRPETIEHDGMRHPFMVAPNVQQVAARETIREIPLAGEAGFGVFHLTGEHVILPKGYRSAWITASEAP